MAAVAAIRRHGLVQLAALLGEATGLFAGYTTPKSPTTWEAVCRQYDPSERLGERDRCIGALDNYGPA